MQLNKNADGSFSKLSFTSIDTGAGLERLSMVLNGCSTVNVTVPQAMRPYISRMDFIIGVQARAPHNCGVLSYNGTMYINMIRNITEPELELHFFRVLQDQGLHVKAESNQP